MKHKQGSRKLRYRVGKRKKYKMVKHLQKIILAAIMLLTANGVWAYDFSAVNNGVTIYYNITNDTAAPYTVTVVNPGWPAAYTGNISIPSTVTNNGRTYSVTSIGDYTFQSCIGLTSITIPNSVISIGEYAFEFDTSLTSVTIGNSVTSIGNFAFAGCAFTSITIPNSVKSIGNNAFSSTDLTSITIPNSVARIDEYAFSNCRKLKAVNFNADSCTTNYYLYAPLPDAVFYNCDSLTTINIGNNVRHIPDCFFYSCKGITSVTIPNSVVSIGEYAFSGCIRMTSLIIGNSVTNIGFYAFGYDTSLTSITIPSSVTGIAEGAFDFCTRLRTVYFNADSCTTYDYNGNNNNYIYGLFSDCNSLTTINIGNNVRYLPKCVFKNCSRLTSVIIPNSVRNIGAEAFQNDTSLTVVTIGNAVNSIGNNAFDGCTRLNRTNYSGTIAQWCDINFANVRSNPIYQSNNLYINNGLVSNLVIPNTVNAIKKYAFWRDTALTSATISNTVTRIGDSALYNCTNLTPVIIPSTVSSIGTNAFYNIGLIIYNGNATGSPWGALSVRRRNGIVNGDFVYADAARTNILEYIGNGGNVTIPNTVTRISDSAFYNCSNIIYINIPNTVKNIGVNAFEGCTGLNWVNYTGTLAQWCDINFGNIFSNPVSQSRNLYINNGFIANLIIPNNVDTIKAFAFSGDTAITSITFGNSVTSIGNNAFYGCSNLRQTNYTGTLSQWCNINFENQNSNPVFISHNLYINNNLITNLTIPNNVGTINAYAFCGDTAISSITFGNSVARIGNYAFAACTGFISVTISNPVINIGEGAFASCSGLNTLTMGNSVTSIGNFAFASCSSLNTLIMGNSVASIGESAFAYCTGLTTVTIPNSVTSIGDHAFEYSGLTSVNIGDSVSSIGRYAFRYCKLSTVTIPNLVSSIGREAFAYCDSLATVYFNADSCTFMGRVFYDSIYNSIAYEYGVFWHGHIKNVIIGDNVKYIPDNAFAWFQYLSQITFYRTNTTIANKAFFNNPTTNIPVNVPCGATSWYRSQMSSFSNFVEFVPYNYSIASQDTTKGSVATVAAPTCNNGATWIIRATANSGYAFTRWNDGDTNPQRIITVNKDTALTAYFSLPVPPWYNFVVVSEDTAKGTVQIVTQPSQASPQATIIALPNTGFRFTRWSDGNTQNPRTLTVTQDTTLIAYFSWYNFAVVSEDTAKGTVQVVVQPTPANPQATIIALPKSGYTFARWSDGNTQNPRLLTVTRDTTLIAFFSQTGNQWYNFAAVSEDTVKGSVQVLTQPSQASPQATIIAVPNTGYRFTRWSDGNTQNPRTLTVTQDTMLIAYFSWYNFSVASEDTAKGTVQVVVQPTPANPQATIVALPNTGYTFTRWSDGNTQNPRTLTVTRDTTIIAYFSQSGNQWYNFAVVSEDTAKGRVQVLTQPSQASPQATILALPNTGYSFTRWSDGNTQNPRTLTVTQDTVLIAYFTSSQQQWYNFFVMSEDTAKGTVLVVNQPTQANPRTTIVATPKSGYTFTRWSDGNTQNPRTLTVTQDTVLIAYFTQSSQQWYNFVVVSEDTAKGTVQVITQPSQASPQATILALPKSGYTFSRWSDGNTQNPRTLTVTQDTVLIAYFTQSSQQWYNFVVVSEDTAKGTVQVITQPSQASPQATILALPKSGYTFTRWSDGNTQNPRTLTVTQDTVLIAYFTSNQGIADAGNDNIIIRTTNGHILLEGIGNERVYVSDVLGRVIYHSSVNEKADIAVKNRGVYFVKVGNRSAQKVVVM